MMSAILLSLAEESVRGPGKQWPPDIRDAAWQGLFDGKKINPLAREISEKTDHPFSSTRRRLQEMKTSDGFKEVKEVEERARAASREASLEDVLRLELGQTSPQRGLRDNSRGAN